MQELIIVCEDAFGLDVLSVVEAINDSEQSTGSLTGFHVKGLLLMEEGQLSPHEVGVPILGLVREWSPSKEEQFAMGIRDPQNKEKAVRILKEKEAVFASLWAPWVLSPKINCGEGCIIAAHSIKQGAVIHDFVTLYRSMSAVSEIGDYSTLMAFCNSTNSHIGKRCLLGSNSAVMLNQNLCDDVCVSANSIVVRSIKSSGTYSGIPARKVKEPIS